MVLSTKEQLWPLRARSVPALLVSSPALLSSGLQLLCHNSCCSRILPGAFHGDTWGVHPLWLPVLGGHLDRERVPMCCSQERRCAFQKLLLAFCSQVLGFEENQDCEWDMKFCKMRVQVGFNMLVIGSVVDEIHNNIYYWFGASRAALCLQTAHCCGMQLSRRARYGIWAVSVHYCTQQKRVLSGQA